MQTAAPKSSSVRFHFPTSISGAARSAASQSILQRDFTLPPCKSKNRSKMRATLVSSTANGCPNALAQMALAVYLPTPGSWSNWASVFGIFPSFLSRMTCTDWSSLKARKERPRGCKTRATSSTGAAPRTSSVGY